jgi:hypothetical protein
VINIAHVVKCSICNSSFDRDKHAFVQTAARRYAHADCALRKAALDEKELELEIVDPNDFVTCKYCKKTINKKEEKYIQITNSTYAHLACSELEAKREKTDAEKLDEYIMQLFNYDYVPPRAKKQINQFVQEYNYTYSGIHRSLIYFYEIKGGDRDAAHDGIGIVPFIYQDAYNYYYSLWLAKQRNEDKDLSQYIPRQVEIKITPPEREPIKRKLFAFLDEDEVSADGE